MSHLLSAGMNSGEGLSSPLGPQDISSFSHSFSSSKPLHLSRDIQPVLQYATVKISIEVRMVISIST